MGYKEALQSGKMLSYTEVVNLLAGENSLKYTIPEALRVMMRDNRLHTRSEVYGMIDGIVVDDGSDLRVVTVQLNGDTLMSKLVDLARKIYYEGIAVSDGTAPDPAKTYLYVTLI